MNVIDGYKSLVEFYGGRVYNVVLDGETVTFTIEFPPVTEWVEMRYADE